MFKAYRLGPLDFDGSTIHLFPDLSKHSLYMCLVVRPLLNVICQAGATYTWGHPFSIQVKREGHSFILSDPDQLLALFLFLE